MRTKLRAVPVVLAVAVVGVGSAPAVAHGQARNTLRLVATETQSQDLDLGASGPSLGDQHVISEVLSQNGTQVGKSGVVCTVTAIAPPYEVSTFHCVATLSLRGGQITLQGLLEVQGQNDPGPFTVAITGGTGRYNGAHGAAVVRSVSATQSVYTLRFRADPVERQRASSKKKHRN